MSYKKSYKLIGIEWDRRPGDCPDDISEVGIGRDHRVERDIFDLDFYVRHIKVSEIMSADGLFELDRVLDTLTWCDEIQLLVDNEPKNHTPVLDGYYKKRLGQILHYVRQRSNGKSVLLVK